MKSLGKLCRLAGEAALLPAFRRISPSSAARPDAVGVPARSLEVRIWDGVNIVDLTLHFVSSLPKILRTQDQRLEAFDIRLVFFSACSRFKPPLPNQPIVHALEHVGVVREGEGNMSEPWAILFGVLLWARPEASLMDAARAIAMVIKAMRRRAHKSPQTMRERKAILTWG